MIVMSVVVLRGIYDSTEVGLDDGLGSRYSGHLSADQRYAWAGDHLNARAGLEVGEGADRLKVAAWHLLDGDVETPFTLVRIRVEVELHNVVGEMVSSCKMRKKI